MAHQNQFGLFSYNRTIYDGDPYGAVPTKKIGCDAKRMGKQFVTSPIKRGKTADVYFSPKMVCDCPCDVMRRYLHELRACLVAHDDNRDMCQIESVMVGSKYTTLFDEDRKYQLEKKAKQVGKTFVPPHPSSKAEGKGSYYGAVELLFSSTLLEAGSTKYTSHRVFCGSSRQSAAPHGLAGAHSMDVLYTPGCGASPCACPQAH